jgi:hypothetical protein
MLFRNLGQRLTSDLIESATRLTYTLWPVKYGALPPERLRTEIDIEAIRGDNPGYTYKLAGYTRDRIVRKKLYLWAPDPRFQDVLDFRTGKVHMERRSESETEQQERRQ